MNVVKIVWGFSYEVFSIVLPKSFAFGLSILVLGSSAITLQSPCYEAVTRSKIGSIHELFRVNSVK